MAVKRSMAIAAVVLMIVGGAIAALSLKIETDVRHFLPEGEHEEDAQLSAALAGSELTHTMILAIDGGDSASVAAASEALADRLLGLADVAWLRHTVPESTQTAFYDLYYPRRLGFADLADPAAATDQPAGDQGETRAPSAAADATVSVPPSDDVLRRAARNLRRELSLPTSVLVRRIAQGDPLLLFIERVRALEAMQGGSLDVRNGQLVTRDGKTAIIFLATRSSPFDGSAQARMQQTIVAAFAAVNRSHGGRLRLSQAGPHRFAVSAEAAMRDDITRISVISTVGILLLLGLLFRSVRGIVLTFVPVVVGVAAALITFALAFGAIHGITLAFGSALIGVCVDYAVHLQVHQLSSRAGIDGTTAARQVRVALLLGSGTTLVGLLGLSWTSFPGIREIAMFSVIGVAAALLATLYALPPLLPEARGPGGPIATLAIAGERLFALLRRRRAWLVLGWLGLAAIAAAGLFRLHWHDDVRALNQLDPDLLEEDQRVRALVSQVDPGRVVVATGADAEQALIANDAVAAVLQVAKRDGVLHDYRSLHVALPSATAQERAVAPYLDDGTLGPRFRRIFADEGFDPDAFGDFFGTIAAPPAPLTLPMLLESELGPLVRSFVIDLDGEVAILTFLRDVQEPESLATRLGAVEGARLFDQHRFLTSAFARYRSQVLQLTCIGLVAVFLMLVARYRNLRTAAATFLPAFSAAVFTLGFLSLAGMSLSLLHLVALLLVLSIGVDYGVFVVEHRTRGGHGEGDAGGAVVSITIACITTILSFGLLAMSSSPALASLGITIAVGVGLSLLLSPTALVLFAAEGSLEPP